MRFGIKTFAKIYKKKETSVLLLGVESNIFVHEIMNSNRFETTGLTSWPRPSNGRQGHTLPLIIFSEADLQCRLKIFVKTWCRITQLPQNLYDILNEVKNSACCSKLTSCFLVFRKYNNVLWCGAWTPPSFLYITQSCKAWSKPENMVIYTWWKHIFSSEWWWWWWGGIRLIVGFQPLMVISPTAIWIRWCMQVYGCELMWTCLVWTEDLCPTVFRCLQNGGIHYKLLYPQMQTNTLL